MASGSRTGYCHSIIDEDMDFRTSMLRFARGLGYLIEMRDDPMDAEIPNEVPVSSYHRDERDEALEELARLEQLTPDELLAVGQAERAREIQYNYDALITSGKEDDKLREILAQVEAWDCQEDLDCLKNFAQEQLTSSIKDGSYGGYHAKAITGAIRKTPQEYVDDKIKQLRRDVKYHTTELEKDIERAREKNEWLKRLREALPAEQVAA